MGRISHGPPNTGQVLIIVLVTRVMVLRIGLVAALRLTNRGHGRIRAGFDMSPLQSTTVGHRRLRCTPFHVQEYERFIVQNAEVLCVGYFNKFVSFQVPRYSKQ